MEESFAECLQVNCCYKKVQLQWIINVHVQYGLSNLCQRYVYYHICQNMHATFACNVREWFSLPINSSVNKLTNYHNTTYKILTGYMVCFFWGLFLKPVRYPRGIGIHWMPLVSLYRYSHLAGNHQLTCWWYSV